jgi:hypothetical protein
MSLAAAALRIATVKALKGATSVGNRVFDSEVDVRSLLGENAEPTIVVLAEKGRRKIQGRDILGGDHRVELAIEMFVARATKVEGENPDQTKFKIDYPATDAAHENRLRRLAYEVDSILTGELTPWVEIWKAFAVSIDEDVEWDRGADGDGGRRFNFLRSVYSCGVLSDPPRGMPLTPIWEKLLSLMDSDPELAPTAKDWRALITTPNLPAWRNAMSSLGLSYGELKGMGLAPFLDHQATPTTESAGLDEATLDPDQITIDAQ